MKNLYVKTDGFFASGSGLTFEKISLRFFSKHSNVSLNWGSLSKRKNLMTCISPKNFSPNFLKYKARAHTSNDALTLS